jgi:hypothetical protein
LNASGAPAARGSRLGAAGLIALLIASLVLGLLVYRARTPDLALEVTNFPSEFRDRPAAEIGFFVRFDSDEAKVEIVGRDQVVAKTLAASIALEADEPVNCLWDGRDDEGEKVEPGRYRLRVTLPEEDRVMVFPKRLDVRVGDVTGDAEGDMLVLDEPCSQEEGE